MKMRTNYQLLCEVVVIAADKNEIEKEKRRNQMKMYGKLKKSIESKQFYQQLKNNEFLS